MHFQNLENHGVRYKHSENSLSSLPLDQVRHVIQRLNSNSDHLGCVVFEGAEDTEIDLVMFGGNLERFSMLSVARYAKCRVIYFQDTESWWYGGSDMLPNIHGIASFLRSSFGERKFLSFGQSSGGYAALALGGIIPSCDVLACSPQTFADARIKDRVHIAPTLAPQVTPDYLTDIAQLYSKAGRSGSAFALFAGSEVQNPYQSHFWFDHLHLANIAETKDIDIFVSAAANHSIVLHRADDFAKGIRDLLQCRTDDHATKKAIVTSVLQI